MVLIGFGAVIVSVLVSMLAHGAGLHELAELAHAAVFISMLTALSGVVLQGVRGAPRPDPAQEETDAIR